METNDRRNVNVNEQGQAIVLLVFGMIVLLGMAGLAIDGGNLYTQRRRGQNAVDNAALAYALAINQATTTGQADAQSVLSNNGYVAGQNNVQITIIRPPSGYDNSYVEVVMTQTVPTALIHMVTSAPAVYSVRATAHGVAGTAPQAGFALVAMSNCLTQGGNNVNVTGGGNSGGINVHNGNIFLNTPETNAQPCAIRPPTSQNNTGITVDSGFNISSVGAYDYSGAPNVTHPVQTNANGGTPIADPLASLPEPQCTSNGVISGGMYQPGRYGGYGQLVMGPGTYAPGIYCITGNVSISGNDGIVGNGVVFYFINGGMKFTGNGGLTITAPTESNCLGTFGQPTASCTYVGMAIFLARNNTSTVEVRGNGGSAVTGTIYAMSGVVQARGGGSTPGETSVVGQVIGARVYGNGNGSFDITYQDDKIYHIPPSIQLVK